MLSKVRRRHPSYGNVKARGRPRHGRPGAAPRLSQVRMCAGTCVGRKPRGPLGRGCEEPGGSAGRSSALPPRRTQAGWTFSPRTPPRPGRAGRVFARARSLGMPTSWGDTRRAKIGTHSFSPTRLYFYGATPHPVGFQGLG